MAFMRREGTLMEPRWCTNGTLVPRELAHTPVDREWGPLWMVDGEREMEVALRGAAELAPVQAAAQVRSGAGGTVRPSLLRRACLPCGRASALQAAAPPASGQHPSRQRFAVCSARRAERATVDCQETHAVM